MKVTKRQRRTALFLIAIAMAVLCCISLVLSYAPASNALALRDATQAYQAGGGKELWDKVNGEFNSEVLDDLVDKLFGTEDPIDYIKTMKDTQTDSYVIPASTINAKVGKADAGMVVKLDSMNWMVSSLTLAEIDGEENVVATLYLADFKGTSQYYTNNSNVKGNNAYCRSVVRNKLLTESTWALFQDSGEDSFARQFLVQPQYIKYQETQSMDGRQTNWKNCPNDAWGTPKGSWNSGISYSATDTYDGKTYDSWKYDYIWLPSMTETGASDVANTSCIWKLSNTQRMCSTSNHSWLRSGRYSYYCSACLLQFSGACSSSLVVNTRGVRPALHLNLSSAALGAAGTKLKNPENTTTTYNGDVQTLKSIYDAAPKANAWYNPKWYEHVSNYVVVTPEAELKNAGTYWTKVEIQQAWIDAVYAEIESQKTENKWTDEEVAAQKERRRPRFLDDADTTDATHMESETVRWFQITIKPKEVTVNKPTYNSDTGAFGAPSFANAGEFYADKPALATKFFGEAADGTKIEQIDEVPNKRGTYTAQAILVNSETDKTEYKGNYVIKDAANCTCQVVINRSRLSIPTAAETKKIYNGEEQLFPITGYTADWTNVAELKLPNGVELKGDDTNGWNLAVTDAGSYEITASIKADKQTDWCWNTANFKEEITTNQTITLNITRKTLLVEFTSTNGGFLLQKGAAVTFGVKPSNAYSRDEVKLTLEYYNSTKPDTKIAVANGQLDASTLNPGTYYLLATLTDGTAAGNKNYTLEGGKATQEFTVSAKNIEIDSVTWQYSQNNGAPTSVAGGAGASDASPFEVTYNGVEYVFSIITTNLAEAGAKVDTSYGTNGYLNGSQLNATASAAAITVRLVPFEEGFAFNDPNTGKPLAQQYKDFTFYVKVNKADVDFSQVKWSADELEFNAVNQQVTISEGFPSFLTPTYIHPSATNVGEYTTTVGGVSVASSQEAQATAKNYNIPNSTQIGTNTYLTHKWKIIKKKILVTWTTAEQTQDGKTIQVPVVSDNTTGAIVYTYLNADKTKEMTLDEVFAEYSEVETHTYWACAKLKAAGSEGSAYNETNCVLIEGDADVSSTGSLFSFTSGDNKVAVTVSIKNASVVYNKAEQPVEIKFQGGSLTVNDFTVTYTKVGDASFTGTPKNAGSYKAVITLNSDKTDQYAILGQREFDYTIEKVTFDLSAWKWVDTKNENAEYTEAYVYDGKLHKLEYSGEALEGLTVKYTSETQANTIGTNAGEYHVIVTFETPDTENYVVPENVDFTWKINKADVDFSQVKWSAEELEYNTVNQQVAIESGLPSFLTPTYIHPSATNVGDYTTLVSGVTVNDTTAAANYNIPSASQVASAPSLTHKWKIIKKKISVTWMTVEQTEEGTVIFVPVVSDNSTGAIVYTYLNADRSKEMTLDEIFNEYSEVETHTYWVCAKLKPAGSGGTAYNETNCVLIEGDADVSSTGSLFSFTTGENKTPVRVGIKTSKVVYNKAEQPVEIEFEGGSLTIADFTVTYKNKDGSAFSGVPKYAGEYKAVIALDNGKTDQYAITGQCEFVYIIEKYTYDLSGMKWVDTENGNAEYTEPYVYTKGVSHTLSYVGGDEIEGLTVNYTAETEVYLTGTNAGDYHVVVTFEVKDAANYNVPENVDFTWQISPFTPDLSAVNWNYNTEGPFTFTIVDGEPVKHKVFLNGIPEGLEDLIVYGEDTGEYSEAGSHVTTFAINEESPERKNYGELVFASGLENRLVWEIKSKLVEKPESSQTKVFRADGYSFAEITNLPEDYAQYFDVQVLNSADEEVPATDGTWNFADVDQYRILIKFKTGMNKNHGGTADNVKWSDNARGDYQIVLKINQLIFDLKGWIDGTENARAELDSDEVEEIEKFFEYVIVNTETGETLSVTATLAYETVYTISIKLKPEFSGNVAVNYLGLEVEETLPYAFLTGPDPLSPPPTDLYRKPTADELYTEYRYTGKEIAFKLGDWFVADKMRILGGVLSGTDEGEYQVRVGFKKGSGAAWKTVAKAADTSAVTATFVISKDAKVVDRFTLTTAAAANHPFKFQYGDFTEETNIEEYAYDAAKPLYITRLTINDSLQVLIAQFENADAIKAFDKDGLEITDLTKTLATGMALKIMDGDTVVNVLTLSVLGDINGDGIVSNNDKARLNAFSLGTTVLDGAALLAGDLNFDKDISNNDKARLNAFSLGTANIYEGLELGSVAPAKLQSAPVKVAPVMNANALLAEEAETPSPIWKSQAAGRNENVLFAEEAETPSPTWKSQAAGRNENVLFAEEAETPSPTWKSQAPGRNENVLFTEEAENPSPYSLEEGEGGPLAVDEGVVPNMEALIRQNDYALEKELSVLSVQERRYAILVNRRETL